MPNKNTMRHEESPFAFMVAAGDEERQRHMQEAFLSSDRVGVIVSVARLDEMLEELLRAFFVPDNKVQNIVFGHSENEGALNSLAAKYHIAYLLGLISPNLYNAIRVMAKIRNRFAHRSRLRNFSNLDSDKEGKKLIAQLDDSFEKTGFSVVSTVSGVEIPSANPMRYKFQLLYFHVEGILEHTIQSQKNRNEREPR